MEPFSGFFFVVVVKVIFRKFILQAKVALFISNFNIPSFHHCLSLSDNMNYLLHSGLEFQNI